MKYRLFSLLILLVACGPKNENQESYLSINEMTAIQVDMQLFEALITVQYDINNNHIFRKKIYDGILEKHHTTKEVYEQSLLYYKKNLGEYKALMDSVLKILERTDSIDLPYIPKTDSDFYKIRDSLIDGNSLLKSMPTRKTILK